jgi:phosphatidylglycerol:prolipoprotein diacylglycerol transferase
MKPFIMIFGLKIWLYPTFMYLGILAAFIISFIEAKRKNLDSKKMTLYFWLVVLFGLIISRLIFVSIYIPRMGVKWYILTAFKIWRGGASTVTTIAAGIISAFYLAKILKINWIPFLDAISLGTILGQSIQKLGCFSAGCCFGIPTKLFWGVVFNNPLSLGPKGIKLHPAQLYESFGNFLIFLFLWNRRKKTKFDGQMFLLYLLSYSIFRFFLEFIRGDSLLFYINQFSVKIPQLIALITVIVVGRIYFKKLKTLS